MFETVAITVYGLTMLGALVFIGLPLIRDSIELSRRARRLDQYLAALDASEENE